MFYSYVEKQWKAGKVSVGLSSDPSNQKVYLEGHGAVRLALPFLSRAEAAKLVEASKYKAQQSAKERN